MPANEESESDTIATAAACVAAVCDEARRTWERYVSVASGGDEQGLILQTHYHIVEQLDAVALLLAGGAVEPAKLQLRAVLEALVRLEYILQGDTTRRAYAWLVVDDVLERIKGWERLDPATVAGREFVELQQREGHSLPTLAEAADKRARLRRMLEDDPRWSEAYGEYKRVRTSKRSPEWYELFGGPRGGGLRALALHMGYGTYYEILYRQWSRRMHGSDVMQRLKAAPTPGNILVPPIRYVAEFQHVVDFAVVFGIRSIRLLIAYYRPEDWVHFAQWYTSEFRVRFPLRTAQNSSDLADGAAEQSQVDA